MSIKKPKYRCGCAICGDDQDLSYIVWEGRSLCAHCFPEEVKEYASKFPFMLANELSLDVIQVPEEEI